MLQIQNLQVEYKKNPMGMDEPSPRFFYQLTGDSKKQTAYRITVKTVSETVWDSGVVPSDRSIQIVYEGIPLSPFTRYDWSVQVWDENGTESQPVSAWFETGFLSVRWTAKWISARWSGTCLTRLIRDFSCTKKVRKARLYSTALGVYDVYLNEKKIGAEDVLKPGWTDYFERVQYQAYDVTELPVQGDNTLAVTMAGGWFTCKGYGGRPVFSGELHLEYEDGSSEIIRSDENWKAFYIHIQNPMRNSNLYNGEIYEAWEETDWKLPGGDRVYAVPAEVIDEKTHPVLNTLHVVWQSGAAVRRMKKMLPVSIVKRPNATWLVDFGQNFTGREYFRLENTMQGSTIVIKHGEMLNPDGSLYIENLRNAWQRTIYTTGTNPVEEYEPQYTYYGFRYLEISGWPMENMTADHIYAYAVYSDLQETGSFHCSEPLLNQLYSNIVWGQRSNFLDVPTDCPQRDERQGWTGDIQVFGNVATYNMSCGDFFTKWLEDLNLAQSIDGAYPHIAPKTGRSLRFSGASGWGDAGITVPALMLLKYEDERIAKKYFRNMTAWLDWQISEAGGSCLVKNATFNDWLNIDAMMDETYLSTVCLGGMCRLLSNTAEKIGETQEAERLKKLYNKVKQTVAEHYFDADGVLNQKTQTSAVMALHYGLCPDENARQKTLAYLKQDITVNRNLHLSTGFLGTPLLLKTLTENGETDLAYDLLLQTSYPGWLYPVTQGATTMWERWNSWTEQDGFSDPEMNSFNHYAYGAVGDWFFETICGIQPKENGGMKHFRLAPVPGKRLKYAEASYHSIYGKITSAWKWEDDRTFVWTFTVPVNTSAEIIPPAGLKLLEGYPDIKIADAGQYTLKFISEA